MVFYLLYAAALCLFPLRGICETFYSNKTTSFVSLPTAAPWADCDSFGLCEKDIYGGILGETMEKYLTPNIKVFGGDPYAAETLQLREGDVVVYNEEAKIRVRSGILMSLVVPITGDLFIRYIVVPIGGNNTEGIGYLVVGRPVPDPDTIFESLAQDPFIAEYSMELRASVDPALIIPSPTPGCAAHKCVQFLAVSIQVILCNLPTFLTPIQSADVFYFGPEPTNTACLSSITSAAPSPTIPPMSMYLLLWITLSYFFGAKGFL